MAAPLSTPLDGLAATAGRGLPLLSRAWYRLSVRWQILLAFVAITTLVYVVAETLLVFDARNRTAVEMRAPMELAERIIAKKIRTVASEEDVRNVPFMLADELRQLRHVRISVVDAKGSTSWVSLIEEVPEHERTSDVAPVWFQGLVSSEIAPRRIPIVRDGETAATVVIAGDPTYEVAEVWDDFLVLAFAWLGANALMMGVLYVVLGRILEPLNQLDRGMRDLESGRFELRIAAPKVRELSGIVDRFNELAGALGGARQENDRLYRELVSVQEDERRAVATELHDEVGPCLFGITANASSIQRHVETVGPGAVSQQAIASRVGEILSIAERLKTMNRAMLKRLHPVALGRVTVSELIGDLVAEFRRRHPGLKIEWEVDGLERSYGERVDLTMFRSVQEGVTNALRHGAPSEIRVVLTEARGPDERGDARGRATGVTLTISDNGSGIAVPTPFGFGLRAMRERARAEGGTFSIGPLPDKGSRIRISIPLPARRPVRERQRISEATT